MKRTQNKEIAKTLKNLSTAFGKVNWVSDPQTGARLENSFDLLVNMMSENGYSYDWNYDGTATVTGGLTEEEKKELEDILWEACELDDHSGWNPANFNDPRREDFLELDELIDKLIYQIEALGYYYHYESDGAVSYIGKGKDPDIYQLNRHAEVFEW